MRGRIEFATQSTCVRAHDSLVALSSLLQSRECKQEDTIIGGLKCTKEGCAGVAVPATDEASGPSSSAGGDCGGASRTEKTTGDGGGGGSSGSDAIAAGAGVGAGAGAGDGAGPTDDGPPPLEPVPAAHAAPDVLPASQPTCQKCGHVVEPSIVDQVSLAADAITTARRKHPGSAVSIIESALPVLQGRVVKHHADVGRGLNELANAHMSAGVRGVVLGGSLRENDAWSPLWCVQRWPEALELVKQSVPIFEKVYPDGHPLRGLQVPCVGYFAAATRCTLSQPRWMCRTVVSAGEVAVVLHGKRCCTRQPGGSREHVRVDRSWPS